MCVISLQRGGRKHRAFFLNVIREAQEYWSRLPCPCPGESSRPRNWTQVSHITGRFLTIWTTREAQFDHRAPPFQSQVFGDHELAFGETVTWTSLGWHGCHCSKPSLQAGLLRLGEGAQSATLLSLSLPLALVFWSVLTPLFGHQ